MVNIYIRVASIVLVFIAATGSLFLLNYQKNAVTSDPQLAVQQNRITSYLAPQQQSDAATSADIHTQTSHDTVTESAPPTNTTTQQTSISTVAASSASTSHALPLGDGKISTAPKRGYVYACTSNFRSSGADHAGAWIHGDTWDETEKISVQGKVSYPEAIFSTFIEGMQRMLKGNGLPVDATTGIFPILQSDPAYQYDRNPNSIEAYTVSTLIPKNPTFAAQSSCVPMGTIGYALNGVAIYNALDDDGRDAVAHEVQDSCDGHPQGTGQYHYHGPSDCMPHIGEPNALVGYALDGYGIYSMYDANGNALTDVDLDACHGTTSPVMFNGKKVNMYHYVMTREYPYTIGCYRGTPVHTSNPAQGNTSSTQRDGTT